MPWATGRASETTDPARQGGTPKRPATAQLRSAPHNSKTEQHQPASSSNQHLFNLVESPRPAARHGAGRTLGPKEIPPPGMSGDRLLPRRALPLPFCLYGFLPPPLTSERVSVLAVPCTHRMQLVTNPVLLGPLLAKLASTGQASTAPLTLRAFC
jgi:hypothetical protein